MISDHDPFAQSLWGAPYGWNGSYVDNTAVFHVMNAVFANTPSPPTNLPQPKSAADEKASPQPKISIQ